MIKKQNLWFLTLFSLVLVLSVYYITMPNELFMVNKNIQNLESDSKEKNVESQVVTSIKESEILVTMRVNLEEERTQQMLNLKSTLTNEDSTTEEKNNAYEQIKYITNLSVQEKTLEEKIKKEFDIDSFIRINNDQIKVVCIKEKHDINLVDSIMKSIQKEFSKKMSISIQFEN